MGSTEATVVTSQINLPLLNPAFLPQAGIDLNDALIQLTLEEHGTELFELRGCTYTRLFPIDLHS